MAYIIQTPVPSAARTVTGNGQTMRETDQGDSISFLVSTTAVSGTTPTLDIVVEWSMDGGTTWARLEGTPDNFTTITATGNVIKTFPVRSTTYRVVWTIGGTTPSFTFSVRSMMVN